MAYTKPLQLVQIQRVGIKTTLTLSIRLTQCSYVVGHCSNGSNAGSFAFDIYTGDAISGYSFRVVLVP